MATLFGLIQVICCMPELTLLLIGKRRHSGLVPQRHGTTSGPFISFKESTNTPTFKSKKDQDAEKQAAERPRNQPQTMPPPKN